MASPPEPTRIAAAVNTVARETLRRIAAERIAPTPEAYARIYAEIAATHPDHPGGPPPGAAEARAGASIIARLLVQLDVPHAGITVTRKREGLKRALVPRLETLDALFARLNRLMDSWNGPNAETGGHVEAFLGTDIMGHGGVDDDALRAHQASQVMMTSNLFAPHDGDPTGARPAAPSRGRVAASDVSEQHVSYRLAGLLAMLLKNIDELTPESALVGNQIEQIGRVLTAPLTEKKLDEAERCIRALVVRQGAIKHSIDETKRAIREFAETLLERLSSLVTSSDSYATKIVDVAERIAETDDLGKLSTLTRSLLVDARAMSTNLQAERALLAEAQEKTRALESRTAALESELREASTLVRTDPLTHALNRRGFVDAYKAELMRARSGLLPAIVLLDVDDFKRINERYGHSVGDEVLSHLVEVLQRCAAPGQTVSRYGGEEFALLFPATSAEEAEKAVLRMQAALREPRSSASAQLPSITFSAGIARVEVQETLADAITRADHAMRRAKLQGKNCIVVAAMHETPAH